MSLLSSVESLFKHAPSNIHAEPDKHANLSTEFANFAQYLVDFLPQGQDARDVITLLTAVSRIAHEAIDHGAQAKEVAAGVVRVGDKVVAGTLTPAASAVGEAAPAVEAPVAADPPAAPVAPASVPGVSPLAAPAVPDVAGADVATPASIPATLASTPPAEPQPTGAE